MTHMTLKEPPAAIPLVEERLDLNQRDFMRISEVVCKVENQPLRELNLPLKD